MAAEAATKPRVTPLVTPDIYLPPDAAGGSPFCLNPDSKGLRQALENTALGASALLDAAGLADDVRDLHAAMKKLYAGYPELMQDPAFDVDRFFADWEHNARSASPAISLAEGIAEPLAQLRHHIRDKHLSVWIRSANVNGRPEFVISEYQMKGQVKDFDPGRCVFPNATPIAGTARVAKLLADAGGLEDMTTFSAQSNAPSMDVRCGDRSLRFDRRDASSIERPPGPVYDFRVVGDATVIIIRRLSGSPEDLKALEQIANDYDQHRVKPLIVFDFRSNGGGDDGYVSKWIQRAARGKWPAPYVEVEVASARRSCGDWNDMILRQLNYHRGSDPDARAERDVLRAKMAAERRMGAPIHRIGETSEEAKSQFPYKGRIFALLDRRSASSGESAPDALRVALGATIVGERSGGYREYANLRPYVMPRTGIIWSLPTKRNYYDSPREGVGQPVDVYLPPELMAAPVESLVPMLKKLSRK